MQTAEWVLAGILLLVTAGAGLAGWVMWQRLERLQRRLERIEGLKGRLQDLAERAESPRRPAQAVVPEPAREPLPAELARLPEEVSKDRGRVLELGDRVEDLNRSIEKLQVSWKNLAEQVSVLRSGREPAPFPPVQPPRAAPIPPRPAAAAAGPNHAPSAARPEAAAGAAAPAPSFSGLIERRAAPDELLAVLHGLVEGPDSPDRDYALELLGWVTWLCDKGALLRALDGDELVDKIRLWYRTLDYYLWADPEEDLRFDAPPGSPLFVSEQTQTHLLRRLREDQADLRAFLAGRGIERIEAEPGAEFVPGVIERSAAPPEPTRDARLNDRIYRVEPGEGGYRAGERVLAFSQARRYEFRD